MYTISGEMFYVYEYHNFVMSNNVYDLIWTAEVNPTSTDMVAAVIDLRVILNSVLQRQQIALWLASSYYNVSKSKLQVFERIFAVERPYDYKNLSKAINAIFGPFHLHPPRYAPTNNVDDGKLPLSDKIKLARSMVMDDYYEAHFTLIEQYITQLKRTFVDKRIELRREERICFVVAIVGWFVMVGLTIPLLLAHRCVHARERIIVTGLILSLTVNIIGIVFSLHACKTEDNNYHAGKSLQQYIFQFSNVTTSLKENKNNALRLEQFDYDTARVNFELSSQIFDLQNILSNMLGVYVHTFS